MIVLLFLLVLCWIFERVFKINSPTQIIVYMGDDFYDVRS